jgi:hypothetical protein
MTPHLTKRKSADEYHHYSRLSGRHIHHDLAVSPVTKILEDTLQTHEGQHVYNVFYAVLRWYLFVAGLRDLLVGFAYDRS